MNWLDIAIIICVVIGVIHGLATGIIKQVISLISLVLAIILSGTVANWIRQWATQHFHAESQLFSPNVQNAIYYVLAFIVIVLIFAIIANFVDKIINYTPAELINRLSGALFGAFMWALCLSIAFNFLVVFDSQCRLISKPTKEKSICYEPIRMLFPTIFPYIQDFFNK
jgi:membrane protein required for colicin V production